MSSVRQTLTGSVAVCLLAMSREAWAEMAQYICLGQEHGQQAAVTAASETQAVELAKVQWRTVGCYKDNALNGDSAAPPATTQSPPSGVDSNRAGDSWEVDGTDGAKQSPQTE
ncbi:hypothetical protein [Pseudomonas retamae]|uniref:Uncharacterized protein n=1 Tax=Pseudomonas retamae TaxID=702110 RepID=A0ABW7DA43_9PSED